MLVSALALFSAPQALAADEQVPRTGSRIGSDANNRIIVPINENSQISQIRRLLDTGQTESAVALAQDYVKSLDSSSYVGVDITQERYAALNALCAALTRAGRIEDAIAQCTAAIELWPSRWLALNSRGTAEFARRNFTGALDDYRRAQQLAHEPDDIAVVAHNIELVQARLAESSPDH